MNCLVFIRAYCGFRRINLHGINVSFIIYCMFASNNKPSKRSARAERKAAHASSSRTPHRSAGSASDPYVRTSRASHASRRPSGSSTNAYGASNYGSSTHVSPVHTQQKSNYRSVGAYGSPTNRGPYTPRNAHDREILRAKRERTKKRRKRIALGVVAVCLTLVLGGVGAAWAYLNNLDKALNKDVDADLLNSLTVTDSASDPFYMLLIGIDKDEGRESSDEYGGSYRTDSMILARIDPKDKEVTLVSIPRDTQIQLGTHGTQKINAAYAFGGPSGAIKAVEDLAGVSISHYAEIDLDGFAAVVDSLGGIDINVQYEINDPNYMGYLAAGQQTLNGEQALIYCRSRHAYDAIGDGDAIRSANQRTMISAIMKKLMSSDIGTLTNTVSTLAQYITTDYSVADILGLAQRMFGIDIDKNVYSAAVPTTSSYENDVWYEKVNTSEWNKMMSRVKQGLSPTEGDVTDETTGTVMASSGSGGSGSGDSGSGGASGSSLSGTKISVKNGNGTQGCASDAAAKLTPQGAVCETGNADDSNYAKTLVIYDGDNADKAQKVADLLGCGTVMKNDGRYTYTGDILVVVGQDWK